MHAGTIGCIAGMLEAMRPIFSYGFPLMTPDMSIIIVSYDARDLLAECLDSVAEVAQGDGVSIEAIVVDNASSDGSADYVRAGWPAVRVIDAGRNGGMAAGNNVGMLAATGRSMLLLNSDAHVQPGALRAMLDELESADDIGMVAPRLLNVDRSLQRSIRGFPTPWRLATEFWYVRRLAPRSRLLNGFYGAGFHHDEAVDVEWVMGACMLVSRAAVDRIGLMNEAYFMYSEETEWQHALHAAGLRVRFTPAAEVVHLGGGTSRRNWGLMYRTQVTNHVRVMANTAGVGPARRVRRQIMAALTLRSVLYRVAGRIAGVLPGRDGRGLLARAQGFTDARCALAEADVTQLTVRDVPRWPATNDPSLPMTR